MSTVKANFFLDSAGGNTATINGITPALASQAQAQAGTDNTTLMTPLRNLQAGVGAPHFVLEDQKTAGTNGGTLTAGSWQTRTINTEVRDVFSIVTLASNEFTVSANCWIEWESVFSSTNNSASRIYNVTDAVVAGISTPARPAGGANDRSQGGCLLTAGKTYRLESQVSATSATGGGVASTYQTEVYGRICGWRVT